ncbi:MAG: tetratricopeptide repeat protein [Thermoguttaceae bacterium]|jgi:tetratricopeptide (TPR) repeat protein
MAETPSHKRGQIGFYRPGLISPDRLEHTTIGREYMLRDLMDKIENSYEKKTHQHYLFVGPRGVGKTHFLNLLEHRIACSPEMHKKFSIVRFAEETHRLLSFADFLLRICEILGKSKGNESWQKKYTEIAEQEDDQRIIDTLEPMLNQYRQDTGRILVLLLENLDEILTRQIKNSEDIHRLRKFLMMSPSCILVGTSPITFPGLTDVREPFYDFFDIQVLDNLTEQQTVDAIRANLQYDKRNDLIERFEELSPKIKALHAMTGGNPRLVMMHYALIADEEVSEVKQQFEELLDQISPFYQNRIKDLPPQERAVLETMALIRTEPKTPALIARKLRKSQQQTSMLLQRLTKSGYVVVMDHPDDKRSKIYRIKEGFFDLWLSMNESRKQRKRLLALTQFFEMWYERDELEQKRRTLVDQLLADKASSTDIDRRVTTLDYLSDTGTDGEKIAAKGKLAAVLSEVGREREVAAYLDEIKTFKPGGVMQWLTRHGELWADKSRWPDPIRQVGDMIECWQLQRTGNLEEFATRLFAIGKSLKGRGFHEALVDLFLSSARELDDSEAKINLFIHAARSQKIMGDLQNALNTLNDALQLTINIHNRELESDTLNNISVIYHARGDYSRALEQLEKSLAISREIGDREGEGTTLNNISQVYDARGDYGHALDYLEQSLAISREIGDRSGEGTTLNNISGVYYARGDYDRALEHLEQSLAISREIGDRSGEGTTLNNISQIYEVRGDYGSALEYLEQSLAIRREIGDREGEGTTLNNVSNIYYARGDYGCALEYLEQSLAIRREIGDRSGEGTTLNNISQIYEVRGDYGSALEYLEQSLAIRREIGDRSGLCSTLFNIGYVHWTKKEPEAAMNTWLEVYKIAKEIGLKQAIDALDNLAKKMGHDDGLGFWQSLLEKVEGSEAHERK